MNNINLNAGGLIGALVLGAVAGMFVFLMSDQDELPRRASKLVIAGVIGGAFLGNYLWGLAFKKEE